MSVASEESKPASAFPVEGVPFVFDHPLFKGARPVTEDSPKGTVRSRWHEPHEPHFRWWAKRCLEQGWSIFPQNRDGGRRPARVAGQSVRPSQYRDKLPSAAEIEFWSWKAGLSNVAVQFCPASGHSFAIDIDVEGEPNTTRIIRLALEILGETPFHRWGRRPALIYRRDPDHLLRSASYRFEDDGRPSSDQIEILSDGKALTCFGEHYKTGQYFTWPVKHIAEAGPEAAPLVTADQLRQFLHAVDQWRPLARYRTGVASHFTSEAVAFDGEVITPPRRLEIGVWEKDGLGKKLVDGRQEFLFRRAFAYVRLNADTVRSEDGSKAVFARYLDEALRSLARTGRWHSDEAIRREADSIFRRTRDNLLADRIRPAIVAVQENGTRIISPTSGMLAIDGDLGEAKGWLPEPGSKHRRTSPRKILRKIDADHMPDRDRAEKLRLLDTSARIAVGERVADEVRDAIETFLTKLWDSADQIAALLEEGKALPDALHEVGALVAPTGAGKTSTLIRRFVAMRQQRGPLPFALGVFLPGHANAEEAKTVAIAAGADDAWAEAIDAARDITVLQYKGKVAAGCLLGDRMAKLQAANISIDGMCVSQTVDPVTEEKREEVCVHRDVCPVWTQLELARTADLILMPHAYLTAPLPKPVSERIGAIVIDERFWPEIARTAFLPIEALRMARKLPFLLKTDRRNGMSAMDYVINRDRAADLAIKALLAGECPARALGSYLYKSSLSKKSINGLELVQAAKTICGRAKFSALAVRPNMSAAEVDALLARPEADYLMIEWRFWSIVEDAILAYRSGKKRDEGRERRIKLLQAEGQEPQIRISWRGKFMLANRPTFLLDASADERILRKLYGSRSVRVHRVDAPLHLRTVVIAESFSDQSLLPQADANKTSDDRERAAIRLSKVRHLISHLCGLYPTERVLMGSTLPVEKAMKAAWGSPPNADFGHFGAFRGLDAYKHHAVALSVGRMELPIDVLDGLAAAFSYDDETEEADWNADGTGWVGNQRLRAPKGERRLQRRDGAFVTIEDAVFPDGYPWHRTIQAQWREEELRQFAGRLRPVYRTGEAPLWIVCATCVPSDIVVDDVLTLDQVVKGAGLAELARRMGGVLDERGAALHPEVIGGETMISEAIAGMNPRVAQGYATVRIWVDGETEGRLVRVAAWAPDMWQALYDAQRRLGREFDRYEVIDACAVTNALAVIPVPSKLDRAMSRLPNAATATREEFLQERADAETILRERVKEAVQAKPPTKPGGWSAVSIDGSGSRLPLDVLMILTTFPPAEEPKPPPDVLAA